jgi:LacI family transcriptional regulator
MVHLPSLGLALREQQGYDNVIYLVKTGKTSRMSKRLLTQPGRGNVVMDAAQPATMLDVAALAGVGLATVSRVVNGKPGVSAPTVARVQAAIERLDYRHNVNASSLRRLDRKTATIGLVLEDVANPFMSALHRAVEDCARGHGVLVFAGSCDEDSHREQELIGALRARRVDGIIVVPTGTDHSYLLPALRVGTAMVFVDRRPGFLDADTVTSDDVGAARAGVMHLGAQGHRRIAYLGASLAIGTARDRLQGYEQALKELGAEPQPAHVRPNLVTMEEAEQVAAELLRGPAPPTALLSGQNYFTIGAIKALRSLGLQHEVAVVGFDDFALADLLDPPVTVVAHDPAELGRVAAELLFRRLGGDRSPSEHVICPFSLVARGSGEIALATT